MVTLEGLLKSNSSQVVITKTASRSVAFEAARMSKSVLEIKR